MTITFFSYISDNGAVYELTQPEWLWLLPAFIFFNIIFHLLKKQYFEKSAAAGLIDTKSKQQLLHPLIDKLYLKTTNSKIKTPFKLSYVVIILLVVISISQPVKIGEKLPEPPQERDIIFIVDTSVSMILRDYILDGKRIDRMSLLKGILDNFIQKLKGEKMSIIVFGDQAYTLVPLTSDQFLLRRMLSRVQATMAGRFNAIGESIALAVKQATQNNKNIKRKKILVLLTDADQPTGKIDPIIAAQLAKKEKLPLYTIAIGATTIAAEEKRSGGLLYSPVDLNLIQQLSSITGAKNYRAGNPNALENAVQAINVHETNKQEVKPLYFNEPLYYWFLILAFMVFSAVQIISLVPGKK